MTSEDDATAPASARPRRLARSRLLLAGSAGLAILGILAVGTWRNLGPREATAASFEGAWQTTFGRLDLVQQPGGEVEGHYSYPADKADPEGRRQAGVLRGEVRGRVLVGTWSERWPDRIREGRAQFELRPGGEEFVGAWGDGKPPDPDGKWTGARIRP